MGLLNKTKKKNIPEVVLKWMKKSRDPKTTYLIAVLHKPNKKIYEAVVPLKTDIVELNGKPYYAGTDAIFFKEFEMKGKKYNVPYVDVYEGYHVAIHPSKSIQDPRFSSKIINSIFLYLENKVLENRRNKSMNLRKIIMAILIGGAALYIIVSMF